MVQTISHYRIIEKVGQGGMGVVYRAHDDRLDREVALKVLTPGIIESKSSRRHLRKEALALSRLNHPNIATIHDFDTQDGMDFLVMEYLSGATLSNKLTNQHLSETEIISLGSQLAEGLSAAHERGVVHRDIKPSNLQVTPDGRLKIMDFGLAKFRMPIASSAPTPDLSDTQSLAGTLPYMAPEQLLGEDVDPRTDIHAAGSVLYEMATGKKPFTGAGRSQLIGKILHKQPQPPSSLNPKISPELESIIVRCMEKAPENRYQSAKKLHVDLVQLEHADETRSAKTKPEQRSGWTVSPRILIPAFAAILIFIVIAAGYWHWYVTKSAQPPKLASIAVLQFDDLRPEQDQEYFAAGFAEEILNRLAKIPNLKVAARNSAFQFKGNIEDPRGIGKDLDVDNILKGSVRIDGMRVQIATTLVRASDGFQIWSNSYNRDLKDIFELQDEIVKAVTDALQLQLLPKNPTVTPQKSKTNPEAYQSYLQARYFGRLGDKESAEKAFNYINNAIQWDESYAAAYAWRAYLALRSGVVSWLDYSKSIENAHRDLKRAIELDPYLPDGYSVLSLIQSGVEGNCAAAKITLDKAMEIAPGDADYLANRGLIAMCLGEQEEAVELLKQAVALDPLHPGRYLGLGQNLRDLGRYADSEVALNKALDLSPNHVWIHETLGELYLLQGRTHEALREMEKEPMGPLHDLGMALAHHALGMDKESEEALANLVATCANDCAYQIAQVYAYRGEIDQALEWLNRAYRQRDAGLIYVKTDLLFQSLRGDPRYGLLLKRLNL